MNQLYPIIRRVRRPLLPVDEPPRVRENIVTAAMTKTEVSDESRDTRGGSPVPPEQSPVIPKLKP